MKINDIRTYNMMIHGRLEEEDINPTSPLRFTIEQMEESNTSILVRTDQSGIVGFIRHLHSLGLVIISMSCSIENLP